MTQMSVIDAIDLANNEQLYLLTGLPGYANTFDALRKKMDTELKELTVRPIGRPSSPTEVTMTTPVVNDPSTLRSLRGSKVCREETGLITTLTLLRSVPRLPS